MSQKGNSKVTVDPDALERAAQALRELQGNPNAREALIAMTREEEAKKAQYELAKKNKEIEKVKVEAEERRTTLEREIEISKKKADYNDRLERQRQKDLLVDQERSNEKIRKQNEDSVQKQEEIKRQTFDYEYKKKLQFEEQRLEKKAHMQAKVRRETHDLEQKDIVLRETERRKTYQDLFNTGLNRVGQGIWDLLSDKKLLMNFAMLVGLTGGSLYFAKSFIGLGTRFIESRFAKPSLVRETSRPNFSQIYKYPFRMIESVRNRFRDNRQEIFSGIILDPFLEKQLETITYTILNRKKSLAPFRNMMFYGPPGTGKTLFAKRLALNSGLDYAILTGADVAPLGKEAVTELHKVFDWANTSRRGMILFIDEADAYFRKRDQSEHISEDLRNAINTYLYRTGSPSKKFMFVLATNMPEQLDKAVHDRTDQAIYFGLPGQPERVSLLYYYFVKYCTPKYYWKETLKDWWEMPSSILYKKKFITMEEIPDAVIEDISKRTEGFSAREIEKFVINCHDLAFSSENPVLTLKTIDMALGKAIDQHKQKASWERNKISSL